MLQDMVPSFGELIGARLAEILHAGFITPSIYEAAVTSGPVALGVVAGYLDTCLDLPSPQSCPIRRAA